MMHDTQSVARRSLWLGAWVCCWSLGLMAAQPATVLGQDDGEKANEAEQAATEIVLTLLEAGAAPHTTLRFQPKEGDSQRMEMLMTMEMSMAMDDTPMPSVKLPAMRFIMEFDIEGIADNGDIFYAGEYVEADVVDAEGIDPMAMQQIRGMMRSMKGLNFTGVMTDRGFSRDATMNMPDNLDPMMRSQLEGMAESLDQFVSPLPEEPVGVGAKWRVVTPMDQGGIRFTQTVHYTITEIVEGRVTLTSELTQHADLQTIEPPTAPGMTMDLVSLTGSGSGTTTLDMTSMLPIIGQMNAMSDTIMSMDIGMGNDSEMKQQMKMEMRIKQLPAASESTDDKDADKQ